MNTTLKEEIISQIIHNLLKTAHISRPIKEDLFQDLYLYHLELKNRYRPELNIPLEAYLVKFLKWKMWRLIQIEGANKATSIEDIADYADYREETISVDLAFKMFKVADKVADEDKTLLLLRHSLDKSYQELAQITGLSIEGVRKKLKKLETRLKWESKMRKKNEK
mgnify:FL=1